MVGGVPYTPAEKEFAEKIGKTLFGKAPAPELASMVEKWDPRPLGSGGASTDTGDVSWNVPMVSFTTATWVPGTPAHSWQAVAAGGTSIGLKGMIVAAKTIALTAVDLFKQPELVARAKAEFDSRRGPNFKYEPLIGNRKPPLDYRN